MQRPPRDDLESRLISRSRKILCSALALALGFAALAATAIGERPTGSDLGALAERGAGPAAERPVRPRDLTEAGLSQAGRRLLLEVRTRRPLPLTPLRRLPASRDPGARQLCFSLRARGARGEARLCLGGRRANRHRVGLLLLNARGATVRKRVVPARVRRPGPRRLVVAVDPRRLRLATGRYRWRVLENRRGCRGCAEALPARGERSFRLRPVRVVGCHGPSGLVRRGPARKAVALTFDDGPGTLTGKFLDVLEARRVRATFFVLGQEVGGREATLRRALREGHEIANHSTHHDTNPSGADMAATSSAVEAATGFRPCLFRPPGGVVGAGLVAAAGAAGMTTVLWDVDPSDWSNPGSGAIAARVLGAAGRGSIVVMHDSGGDRSGTLAALPAIIDGLRARGYRFLTVSELLGQRLLYRPYG